MSETPSLEPNQPEKQPETVLPGDSGPNDASTRAQDAVTPTDAVAPARTVVDDEPATVLHDIAPEQPEMPQEPALQGPARASRSIPAAPRLHIDHVPSVGHCYPGEPVVLYTRVRVLEEVQGLALLVEMPRRLQLGDVHAPAEAGIYALQAGDDRDELRWELRHPLPAGSTFEFETTVVVPALDHLVHAFSPGEEAESEIISQATVTPIEAGEGRAVVQSSETAVIALRRKGSYLKYLPAVYERDPFMGRFLMLFESFWGPIDGQINTLAEYFDPMLTTLPMLKWLADRLDLKLDDELPVAVIRRLVAKAVPLYRRRGTRSGLQELLEIYTGGVVHIVERRANNLRLGSGARLGQGVALGVRNQPHTFTLRIKLPPIPDDPTAPHVSERQRERRRERIRALIELEKPAHVTYTLDVDED